MEDIPMQGIIIMILLVLVNALISAAESAFENVNEAAAEKRAEEGDKRAIKLVSFLQKPNRYINVVETMLTATSIVIGMIFIYTCYDKFADFISDITGTDSPAVSVLSVILITIILIYLVVLLGVLFPKRLAIRHAESIAYRMCGMIAFLSILLAPVSWVLEKNTNLFLRICGINPNKLEDNVTEEELMSILNEGQEQGIFEADEAEMISNIIDFNEKQAKDIMTHRKKIVAVSCDLSIGEAMNLMLGESFSRFPLYKDNIDNIVGVLHLKDVMKCYVEEDGKEKVLSDIARKPYFVPDTQNIDVLFQEMQLKKIHMAIVIDEYGQTAGLVAMEDVLEEIVGDIQDEYDIEEVPIVDEGDGIYLIRGDADLGEVVEHTGMKPEEDDLENYDTLNGLLISLLDRIPADGETAVIDYCGFRFEIIDARSKMIHSIRVSKLPEETEDDEKSEKEQTEKEKDMGNTDAVGETDKEKQAE